MALELEAPDHTTVSRRSRQLEIDLRLTGAKGPLHLLVDSTGLSIIGEGEWAAVKHGGHGKRAWKKLHLAVDRSGTIVAEVLTNGNADDARAALGLMNEMDDVASFTADAAYDTTAIYDAAVASGAKVIVPPRKTATKSKRSTTRDRTVRRVRKVGRRQWKKESGYHQQARVENTFFRYKSIIGAQLRARHSKSQEVEAVIACNILNRMTELGRPESFAIGSG
jgi:transposase